MEGENEATQEVRCALTPDEAQQLQRAITSTKEQQDLRVRLIKLSQMFQSNTIYLKHNKEEILEKGHELHQLHHQTENHYQQFLQEMSQTRGICTTSQPISCSALCQEMVAQSARSRSLITESDKQAVPLFTVPNQEWYGNVIYFIQNSYTRARDSLSTKSNKQAMS